MVLMTEMIFETISSSSLFDLDTPRVEAEF